MFGQPKAVKEAEKKKEQRAQEQELEAKRKHDELLLKHFNMQGKKTQKRMKENKKLTEKYYKQQTHKSLYEKFCKKRKKKIYKPPSN